jgi:putative transposase
VKVQVRGGAAPTGAPPLASPTPLAPGATFGRPRRSSSTRACGLPGRSQIRGPLQPVAHLRGPECVRHDRPFRGGDDLELATLSWVHWFTTNRLHSRIGNIPPIEHENDYDRPTAALTEDNAARASLH